MFQLQTVVTEKCNLSCTYCYMKNKNTSLSKNTFDEGFDFVVNTLKPYMEEVSEFNGNSSGLTIAFFGGEPLLNLGLMVDISNDKKYKKYKKHFPTNGLLLDKETYDTCISNNLGISISFDGLGNINNRVSLLGDSTLNSYNNFHLDVLKRHGCKCMISNNVISNLFNIFKFFIDKDIYYPDFSLVRDNIWGNDDYKIIDVELYKIDEYIHEFMRSGKLIFPGFYLLYILDTIFYILYNKKRPFGCFANGVHGCCLMPNGKIYPCARFGSNDKYILGDINNKSINKENIKFLQSIQNPCTFEECIDCELYNYCNVQCNYSMLENGQYKKMVPINNLCKVMKTVYKHALNIYSKYKDNKIFISYLEERLKNVG